MFNDDGGKGFDMTFNPGVRKQLMNEINDINTEFVHNMLFIASDGVNIFKALHVHPDALAGEKEPVLFKGADDNSYIAVYSDKTLHEIIRQTEQLNDDSQQQNAWQGIMADMVTEIAEKIENDPPSAWVF